MKIISLAIALSFFLSSCTYVRTTVNVENPQPPITNDYRTYIYAEDINNIPENSQYIGTIESQDVSLGLGTVSYLLAGVAGIIPIVIRGEDESGTDGLGQDILLYGLGTYMISQGVVGPLLFDMDLMISLENKATENGGNLILLDKDSNPRSLKGKLYKTTLYDNRARLTEDSIRTIWASRKLEKIEGIYEQDLRDLYKHYSFSKKIKYAIIKQEDQYLFVYLNGFQQAKGEYALLPLNDIWQEGDIMSYMKATDNENLFSTNTLSYNMFMNENTMLKNDEGNLYLNTANSMRKYRKIYPDSSKFEIPMGGLTGFAINENKILTCFHGVTDIEFDKTNVMYVKGINGDYNKKHQVVLEKSDRGNDLAILRFADTTIKMNIENYPIASAESAIASETFVIGYPLSTVMGEDIKLTNGIISANSGYAGNQSFYQMTAAIQAGNSGSPVFDKNGNLIGMATSTVTNTDNVSYALKLNTIKDFLTKHNYKMKVQEEDKLKDMNLNSKVKYYKNNVLILELVSTKVPK